MKEKHNESLNRSYCWDNTKNGEKEYKNYLTTVLSMQNQIMESNFGKGIWHNEYQDPDGNYKNGFYCFLTHFLSKQEENLLKSSWKFVLNKEKPESIKAILPDKSVLYLRSDQLGFSAVGQKYGFKTWSPNYPYARYLQLCGTQSEKLNDHIDFIGNCIRDTRTIGGSFLWPLSENSKWSSEYNKYRGVGSYIEDSVDLTLFEVKHFFGWLEKNISLEEYDFTDDVLYKNELRSKNSNMAIWLKHFKTFNAYIDFCMLNDFVDEDYNPIDITKSFISEENPKKDHKVVLTEVDVKNYKQIFKKEPRTSGPIIVSRLHMLDSKELYRTLNNLRVLTLRRKERMLDIL